MSQIYIEINKFITLVVVSIHSFIKFEQTRNVLARDNYKIYKTKN